MEATTKIELTESEVDLINTKLGLRNLFSSKKTDVKKALRYTKYENDLTDRQVEMVKLQSWVIKERKKVVVIFEGRDAAGKGGAIRRITAHINPRHFRIVALNKPTEDEKGQWYFQRYVNKLPKPGEIVFFDRSWYNRAIVEPVNNFCTQKEYSVFMSQINPFEKMVLDSDTFLVKIYFSISKEEQIRRFEDIKKSDLKRWKISPVDERAIALWDDYTKYKDAMFENTNEAQAPWMRIDANKKTNARIKALDYILENIPYDK
ncbi:polyphosphate kinase 2 [Putridiphycobacter roseus]|uniref:ADP/GDP-polyphosphate phosphotransferase n=1 Tax=Putridiphycobacter roseus TaxID=2219161 RepID=A0A2W1MX51_9FLAO|nr:polyphosphate kinase 2 [Putridiphycobacter roseus]PZE15740.1 polyphosphate kinase 2 [Putridiphycobacter roseus]